jgi:hypothetical protein
MSYLAQSLNYNKSLMMNKTERKEFKIIRLPDFYIL